MRKKLTPAARRLRSEPTEAEKRLWPAIRMNNLGVKFRRQAVIGKYIVDFVSFEKKLVVELDGGQHARSEEDILRDHWLNSQGFEVLRFWNTEVFGNLDGVLRNIMKHLNTPSHALPTRGREPVKT